MKYYINFSLVLFTIIAFTHKTNAVDVCTTESLVNGPDSFFGPPVRAAERAERSCPITCQNEGKTWNRIWLGATARDQECENKTQGKNKTGSICGCD